MTNSQKKSAKRRVNKSKKHSRVKEITPDAPSSPEPQRDIHPNSLANLTPGHPGRPKMTPERVAVRDLCRDFSVEAVHKAVEIMRLGEHKESIKAIQLILDRAWGRPAVNDDEGNAVPEATIVLFPDNGEDPRLIIEGKLDHDSAEVDGKTREAISTGQADTGDERTNSD